MGTACTLALRYLFLLIFCSLAGQWPFRGRRCERIDNDLPQPVNDGQVVIRCSPGAGHAGPWDVPLFQPLIWRFSVLGTQSPGPTEWCGRCCFFPAGADRSSY